MYEIKGSWKKGIAFNIHTTESIYLGENEYGRPIFDSTRSDMGELLYQLKYNKNRDVIPNMIRLLEDLKGIENFDFIIPVPSSNKNRSYQPVDEIAKALGKQRSVEVLIDFFEKESDVELKDISDPIERERHLLTSISIKNYRDISNNRVLLLDDLFRSGATLNACCSVINQNGGASEICVLTMTKTRSNK